MATMITCTETVLKNLIYNVMVTILYLIVHVEETGN